MLLEWDDLPDNMRLDEVRPYYDALQKKRLSLFFKRVFDIVVSMFMLIVLSPLFLFLSIAIKIDSPGPVFFRQVRVTQYGKRFRIFKFRTMVINAERIGAQVTCARDTRVTNIGRLIRKYRIDEIAQLIDVFRGTMTFVGVRPEVVKYVVQYQPEWFATFLLPAGVTNLTSIFYHDESKLLESASDTDKTYILEILPEKMKWNLKGIKSFSIAGDIKLMFATFFTMCGREYRVEEH